jgi:hypothetical protein
MARALAAVHIGKRKDRAYAGVGTRKLRCNELARLKGALKYSAKSVRRVSGDR